MLTYLRDPANAITAIGISLSGAGLVALFAGRLEIAVAFGLWSMLADQIDGVVAGRTKNRTTETASIGKCLDGLGDMIYGAALPALTIVVATDHSLLASIVAVLMLVAGALRLSYFSVFGLSGGWFRGLPLSYDVPVLALFLLARPWLPIENFAMILTVCAAGMAILHVTPIRVPAPRGAAYLAIIALCLILSAALILQATSPNK